MGGSGPSDTESPEGILRIYPRAAQPRLLSWDIKKWGWSTPARQRSLDRAETIGERGEKVENQVSRGSERDPLKTIRKGRCKVPAELKIITKNQRKGNESPGQGVSRKGGERASFRRTSVGRMCCLRAELEMIHFVRVRKGGEGSWIALLHERGNARKNPLGGDLAARRS